MSLLSQLKLGIVGGGNMASALLGGLMARGLDAAHVLVAEPEPSIRAALAERFGVTTVSAAGPEFAGRDAIVMAVKPQSMRAAARALAAHADRALIVSIAAGIRIDDLARWLAPGSTIVRSMPNTPALIGQGITGLYAGAGVSTRQCDIAAELLGAVGRVVWVEDEGQLDAVTAVSGSGPAYFFYFMEALEEAARRHGISPAAARLLALQTGAGAAALALQSTESLETLRARVTSKGGTTFAGLEVLRHEQVAAAIGAAVDAATARSRELGDEFGRDPD